MLTFSISENALPITANIAYNHPRAIPALIKNYRLIRKLNINLAISNTYYIQLIESFKKLEEIGFSGCSSMEVIISLFQHLPYLVQRFNFKNQFEVNDYNEFLRFSYNYGFKTIRIKLCFNPSINKQCIENLINFPKLQSLKLESSLTLRNIKFLFETLKEIKFYQLINVQPKDFRSILEECSSLPQLNQILLANRPEDINIEDKVKIMVKSIRIASLKMVKYGHFGTINTFPGMTNILYVSKPSLVIISYETEITSLLKSKFWLNIKYLLLYSTTFGLSGVYEMLKKNNIQTLCLQEEKITQEIINIFILKASINRNLKYSISIISNECPKFNFKICENFTIYLNTRLIIEGKLV